MTASPGLAHDVLYRPQPTRRTSWQLVGNLGCQPGLATSFQLVRLVGCGLMATVGVKGLSVLPHSNVVLKRCSCLSVHVACTYWAPAPGRRCSGHSPLYSAQGADARDGPYRLGPWGRNACFKRECGRNMAWFKLLQKLGRL